MATQLQTLTPESSIPHQRKVLSICPLRVRSFGSWYIETMESPADTHCRSQSFARYGFTIPEVAVLLAIFFCLFAATAPFLLDAIERSRSTACVTHLRALASASQSHAEAQKGRFPAGQIAFTTKADKIGKYADPDEVRLSWSEKEKRSGASWTALSLKYFEGDISSIEWNSKGTVTDNRTNALKELPVMYCPTRRGSMEAEGRYAKATRIAEDWKTGGNDYAACAGSGIAFNDLARQTWFLTPRTTGSNRTGRTFSFLPTCSKSRSVWGQFLHLTRRHCQRRWARIHNGLCRTTHLH